MTRTHVCAPTAASTGPLAPRPHRCADGDRLRASLAHRRVQAAVLHDIERQDTQRRPVADRQTSVGALAAPSSRSLAPDPVRADQRGSAPCRAKRRAQELSQLPQNIEHCLMCEISRTLVSNVCVGDTREPIGHTHVCQDVVRVTCTYCRLNRRAGGSRW